MDNSILLVFPGLFRGDFKWGIIQLILAVVTSGLSGLVFMFIYNKLYLKDVIMGGYKAVDATCEFELVEAKVGMKLPRKD